MMTDSMKELRKKREPTHIAYLWLNRFRKHFKAVYYQLEHKTNEAYLSRRNIDKKMGAIRLRYCKYAQRTQVKHLWRCRLFHKNGLNDPAFLMEVLIEGPCSNCRRTKKEKDIMFLGRQLK